MLPSGVTERSRVLTPGSPVPSANHVPESLSKIPTSVATMSRPPVYATSFAGASGRFAEMSTKFSPPSFDSYTCPYPADGVHRRENADTVSQMWFTLPGSMVIAVM